MMLAIVILSSIAFLCDIGVYQYIKLTEIKMKKF